jgi:dipeptidase E
VDGVALILVVGDGATGSAKRRGPAGVTARRAMRSAVARGQEPELTELTELTALPSIGEDRWVSWVRDADVLLVDGGDATSLCHWLRASGLAALLPSLPELVWVGVSAGSMVLTPRIGDHSVEWSNAPDDRILGIVDFSIFPHLDYPGWPGNALAKAREWVSQVDGPAYAIGDQTAITVVDDVVTVVSEGHWEKLSEGLGSGDG